MARRKIWHGVGDRRYTRRSVTKNPNLPVSISVLELLPVEHLCFSSLVATRPPYIHQTLSLRFASPQRFWIGPTVFAQMVSSLISRAC